MSIIKHYTKDNLTVQWEPEKCTHSTNCWKQLITVFNPRNHPWVNMEGASNERIKTQIDRCPSRALSYAEEK
ncbi:(4Fe-4S)-binding protein [Siphonobacter sp. SORGH_AS_1065]|uniref:(4Fe-4S)-binding protein n=1 Tax=Siphonobacter sp. SORGH_AS_1065 TaxID=3041795 RepID=UPI002787ED70|nr:(4Fe-4S)-binding protein [Siphonobacter sp. SORGH_AS_1065]MDQ1085887.1 putative Fe-S cluster protein YjdI [Siphonobacter sp. SORGH_AS_1065]